MNTSELDKKYYYENLRVFPEKILLEKLLEYLYTETITKAGPMMVIDPEKAIGDLQSTLEKTRIAVEQGLKVILVGGSTDQGETSVVVPALQEVIDATDRDTILLSFPGSSRQVVKGVDAVLLLDLPQIYEVFEENKAVEEYFREERNLIIDRSRKFNVPLIPVTYIIFSAGRTTSVERATGIKGLAVDNSVSFQQAREYALRKCNPGKLVFLELGSNPVSWVNLSPIAEAIYEATGIVPIISGGINSPEKVATLTRNGTFPIGFGSLAENTLPENFKNVYSALRKAHPLTR
jgi:heptaprenylglyceryl phosphate synthase